MRTKKPTSLLLVIMIVGSLGLVSCSSGGNSSGSSGEGGNSGSVSATSISTASVVELFEKAGITFAKADSVPTASITVTVRNIEQVTSSKITYWNNDYGFAITLPKSWEGFTLYQQEWKGYLATATPSEKPAETGPILVFRNPQWTASEPYQDIPIMVFTPTAWAQVESEELSVSAAPMPPTKLGENSHYVFALPARYNYAYPKGWEEVDQIMKSNPLSMDPTFQTKQTSGYMVAEVWVEAEMETSSSNDWRVAQVQTWLDKNKYYLTEGQVAAVQDWIKSKTPKQCMKNDPLCVSQSSTGYWGYRLYSPSLEEASKGNYDVWFWTDIDKLPQGEITNWEPTILIHLGISPEETLKEVFERVAIPSNDRNCK